MKNPTQHKYIVLNADDVNAALTEPQLDDFSRMHHFVRQYRHNNGLPSLQVVCVEDTNPLFAPVCEYLNTYTMSALKGTDTLPIDVIPGPVWVELIKTFGSLNLSTYGGGDILPTSKSLRCNYTMQNDASNYGVNFLIRLTPNSTGSGASIISVVPIVYYRSIQDLFGVQS